MNVSNAEISIPTSNTGDRIGSRSDTKPMIMFPGNVPAENNENMSADSELVKFIYSWRYVGNQ